MEGLGSLLFFALIFFLMMRFGCGSHAGHGDHGSTHAKSDAKKHVDPVCGMTVDMDKGYGKMHEGSLYRFCTRSCLDKFEKQPDHYLNRTLEHNHGDKQ